MQDTPQHPVATSIRGKVTPHLIFMSPHHPSLSDYPDLRPWGDSAEEVRHNLNRSLTASGSKRAHAHQFIEQLEMGYETNAGDRSIKLSGGQKQRIALARALLRNPSLLILDEATSALDTETEKLVQSTFSQLGRETSQIVIAHRLSTVLNADQVLVMGEGVIVESGAPEDLLARSSSEFFRLWKAQLS